VLALLGAQVGLINYSLIAQVPDTSGKAAENRTIFSYPCKEYLEGMRGKGNFGALIKKAKKDSVFGGTYHLAEDIWLPGGTEVKSAADGIVVYSDFSPTWTGAKGYVHWNLGNVIVIEHKIDPPEGDLKFVCTVYIHLGADRKVKVGDTVKRGQLIGFIGKHKSDENGRYPAHLHFGIHKGPYYQISPAWRRKLINEAKEVGLPDSRNRNIVKGDIEIKPRSKTYVVAVFKNKEAEGAVSHISLLVTSTSPKYKPADIIGWCSGYGDKETVDEWLRPSTWIKERKGISSPTKKKR